MALKVFGGKYYVNFGVYTTKAEAKRVVKLLHKDGKLARMVKAWDGKTGKFSKWQVWFKGVRR